MTTRLELHLTLDAGREVECARFLRGELRPETWAILAALAAEIVQEHENRTGSTVVVVAGPEQAQAVLRDIAQAVR